MAFIQTNKIPPNKKEEFTLRDFSGGLNNRTNIIKDNQSSFVLNMKFGLSDVLEKRNGFKHYDSMKLNAPITFVDLYQPYVEADEIVRATSTEVYIGSKMIQRVNGNIVGVNFNNRFMFCDGSALYSYAKHPSASDTYNRVEGASPLGNVSLKVVSTPTEYTPLDNKHHRGVTVINYTTGTIHYEPCINELEDPYKGVSVPPENPAFLVVHGGRLFVSGDRKDDDNVFITDLNNPFYFAVSLPIQLPPNSDKVRGMVVYDDSVVVGRERDMYYISGKTNNVNAGFDLFTLRKINSHTGFANHKSYDVVHGYLFFLGSDGIMYGMTNIKNNSRVLQTQILSQSIDVFKQPLMVTKEELQDASSCFDSEYWYVTIGEMTLVYSYRQMAWTVYDEVDMYSPFYYFDKLIWGRKDGTIAEWSDKYLDLRKPMYCTWQSKVFDMGSAIRYKQFRELYIVAHTFDDSNSDIRVTFEIDYQDVNHEIVIENKIARFGEAVYGDRFINRNINTSIPFVIGRRAKNFKVIITNGYRIEQTVQTFEELKSIRKKYNFMGAYVEGEDKYYYFNDGVWSGLDDERTNQPLMVYQINCDYEMKGKR